MGGKKKSLANKLAKMSDEERSRYLQHRADIEEETRRKKEQLISAFMKEKVKKEDAFARLNLAKINQNWHQILRKDKCKRLNDSVARIQEDFARVLENKNRSIHFLLTQLDEAEIQYAYNYQNHIMQIDKIMKTQNDYLINEMRMQYEKERQELLDDANQEVAEISEKHKKDIEYLKVLKYSEEMNSKKNIAKQYEYYKSKTFNILNENGNEMRRLFGSRERASGALWRLISANVLQYSSGVDRRRSHLAELRALDREGAAEVARNQALIQRKEAEICKLKKRYSEIVAEGNNQLSNLRTTLEKVSKKCLDMKIYLNKQLTNDGKRLTLLVDESNDAAEYLERFLEKGKQIVQLMAICEKFETVDDAIELIAMEYKEKETESEDDKAIKEIEEETDKFLARFDAAVSGSIRTRSSSDGSDEGTEKSHPIASAKSSAKHAEENVDRTATENVFDNMKDLEKVWRKYNLIYMNIAALKEERDELAKSNDDVRCHLRQMIGNIMVLKNQTKVVPTEEVFRTVIKC